MALRPFAPVGPSLQGSFPLRQAGVALGASAAGGLALATTGRPALAFGALAGFGLIIAGIYRPALFLAIFLIARPLMDDLSHSGIPGLHSANVAGALAVMALAVLVAAVASRERLLLPPATPAFALFLLASALAAVLALAEYPEIGTTPYSEMAKLAALLAVYILAANLFGTPARVQRLFVIVALSAVLPALDGIQQLISGPPVIAELGIGRVTGTFVGPNPFGAYLAIAAILLTVLPAEALTRRVRIPALAIILVALVATYSREGWVMFLVGMVLLHWRRRTALVVTVILATVAVVAVVPSVHDRVLPADTSHQARTSSVSSTQPTDSFSWRLETWRKLMGKYDESPVVGFGLTTVPLLNPRRYSINNGATTVGWAAHNSVVRALFEGGIPLLLTLIGLFAALIYSAARVARRPGPLQWAARTMLVMWTIIVIVGLGTDDPIDQTACMYALLAMAGAVAGASAFAARTEAASRGTHDV